MQTVSQKAYVNPVYHRYFADPFAFKVSDQYYAVGTGADEEDPDGFVFQVLHSTDLTDWQPVSFALRKPAGYETGSFWAPEITQFEGEFHMYYSVGFGDKGHHIRLAKSSKPEGPYEDICQISTEDLAFAIDAHVYVHSDGTRYLFYATDLLDTARPGTSIVVDELISAYRLAGKPTVVARASQPWQMFESQRAIYDSRYDWHTLEGPATIFRNGKLYVFYSGGNWQNETYGVDYVVADHPLGPYSNSAAEHPRVLATIPGQVLGPGHNSFVVGPDGDSIFAVYHAWNTERTARLMRIDPVVWSGDIPKVAGPSTSEQSILL